MVSGICEWTQRINLSAPDVGNESKRNAGWFIGPLLKPRAQWSCFSVSESGPSFSAYLCDCDSELQAPIPWAGTERSALMINQSLQCHDRPESNLLSEPKHSHWMSKPLIQDCSRYSSNMNSISDILLITTEYNVFFLSNNMCNTALTIEAYRVTVLQKQKRILLELHDKSYFSCDVLIY